MNPSLDALTRDHALLWRGNSSQGDYTNAIVDTGIEPLNEFLPTGGWPANSVVELVVDQWGSGELQILLPLLSRFSQEEKRLMLIAPPYVPYAPALLNADVKLDHLVILDNSISPADIWWAAEKILRHDGCALTLIWPQRPDYRHIRRLQIAADAGQNLGILMHRGPVSDAPVPLRLKISPSHQGISLRILKSRFGWQQNTQLVLPIS